MSLVHAYSYCGFDLSNIFIAFQEKPHGSQLIAPKGLRAKYKQKEDVLLLSHISGFHREWPRTQAALVFVTFFFIVHLSIRVGIQTPLI